MTFVIGPDRLTAPAQIQIRNTQTFPLTLEFSVEERVMGPDGKEARRPADADFVLFPPVAVVAPQRSQLLRVQWVGGVPNKSKSYYINVKQQPIDLGEANFQGVRLLTNFGVSCHVIPPNVVPTPTATKGELRKTNRGLVLRFDLANDGSKYFYIYDALISVKGNGIVLDVDEATVRDAVDSPLVLPGMRRTIEIPLKARANAQPVTVSFTLPQQGKR